MSWSSMPGKPWTLARLEEEYPWIAWREPVSVRVSLDGHPRYACRVCIANHGLRGTDVQDLPKDPGGVRDHLRVAHEMHTDRPKGPGDGGL